MATACTNDPSTQAIFKSTMIADWSQGQIWEIYKKMNKKFKQINLNGLQNRKTMLDNITMGITDDPSKMFVQLWEVQLLLGGPGVKKKKFKSFFFVKN